MLVLGGARSGKSQYAESVALAAAPAALYIATGSAGDAEMAERIRHHRARRGPAWHTIELPAEKPAALADTLIEQARPNRPILVDCLTLWLSNLLLAGVDIERQSERLTALVPLLGGPVIFVANEVGLGIVPDNALARAFRDHAGRLNQAVAASVDAVIFIAAGLPLILKPR
jgi:adenosylcobinamide kinase / adenosylcobinamide-phosphate guanylyltransferase